MTAEKDPARESTVNKRYEPPSEAILDAARGLAGLMDSNWFDDMIENNRYGLASDAILHYLDSLPEHVLRALLYHARNGGLA